MNMHRLINKETNRPVVEFKENGIVFHNKFLENEMRYLGILIPHGLRGNYHGKDCIFLGDQDFQKAFKEVYFMTAIDHQKFKWDEKAS